ncbi:DUF2489 domain-containing protein [Marinospirillum insulare]|uniref:DUF2489 domain-containing protein n=1 Tax=Marinospirillum insulare TaxID=217169 RepID=A0ABQ5ZSU0_9GAMM|nr:DUF2489 domain-containing protein [Marinospirillum insulare]GLR63201.1 hypothetical protein GCM10007878_06360 [Marinospirillum insulare]
MSALDAAIWLTAAIAIIIPLAGYALHLHFEAKRQVAIAAETHERERLQARANVLENLSLLAKALQDEQVNPTEGCLRVRVFLDLLDEGVYVNHPDLIIFDRVYQQTKHLATHQERTDLAANERAKQDQEREAIEAEFSSQIQQAAIKLGAFCELQTKQGAEPLFVNAAEGQ